MAFSFDAAFLPVLFSNFDSKVDKTGNFKSNGRISHQKVDSLVAALQFGVDNGQTGLADQLAFAQLLQSNVIFDKIDALDGQADGYLTLNNFTQLADRAPDGDASVLSDDDIAALLEKAPDTRPGQRNTL